MQKGGSSWDTIFQPVHAVIWGFGSLHLQGDAQLRPPSSHPGHCHRQVWGTGQSCCPVGPRSWLSSQPIQEQPAQPPLEALTLQMFRDSAHSRNSQRARNSGWRVAAPCSICQHRRKVSGGRRSPSYPLYPVPMGTAQPLCPSQPGRASTAMTLLHCQSPPASPCKVAAPRRASAHHSPACSGKAGPTSKQSAGKQLRASGPNDSPASRIKGMRQARGHHKIYNCLEHTRNFKVSPLWTRHSRQSVLHPVSCS